MKKHSKSMAVVCLLGLISLLPVVSSSSATPTPTIVPSQTPTFYPSATPSVLPTVTPSPTGTPTTEVQCSGQFLTVLAYNDPDVIGGTAYATSSASYAGGPVTYATPIPVDSCPSVDKGMSEKCIDYATATTVLKNQACTQAGNEIPVGNCDPENGKCVKCKMSPPPVEGKCKRSSNTALSRACTFTVKTIDGVQKVCALASKYCPYFCSEN